MTIIQTSSRLVGHIALSTLYSIAFKELEESWWLTLGDKHLIQTLIETAEALQLCSPDRPFEEIHASREHDIQGHQKVTKPQSLSSQILQSLLLLTSSMSTARVSIHAGTCGEMGQPGLLVVGHSWKAKGLL